ncbi:MAG TPA: glycosyltransferase family 4 protein [Stellaceae bacterium]|nr:glycosyltransferase family 4 protein [Stellaceae bacterium]
MIHFFTKISNNPVNLEFNKELEKIGVDYRCFGALIPFEYRSRVLYLLIWYPKMAYHAFRLAVKSLILSKPHPTTVVHETDVDVLVFSFVRLFLPWKKPKIVYLTFIFTRRSSPLYQKLRIMYYRFVLSRCVKIICHSENEIALYAETFPSIADRFEFLPLGMNVGGWRNISIDPIADDLKSRRLRVLSVGRSGRDYPTLAAAVAGEEFDVTVVCDSGEALRGLRETDTIKILRDCYDADYFAQLRSCDVMVVPLAVENISQGQMVVVQAMAYGKPIVVTRTPTICHYLVDGVEALMVPLGDASALRAALRRLRDDPDLYQRLRWAAREGYVKRHSLAVYTKHLVAAIEKISA